MGRKENSDISSLVCEVENSYDVIENIYEDCYSKSFEINNENVNLLKDIVRHSEELFSLLSKIANYITEESRINVGHQEMTIRDGFIYRYSSSKKIDEEKLYSRPEIKAAVRENCSSEELADKFDNSYDLSKYIYDIFSSNNYSGISKDDKIPSSFSYRDDSDREEAKDYVIYSPSRSNIDEIRFKPYKRYSLLECFKKDRVHRSISKSFHENTDKNLNRTKEEYIRQIWYSDVIKDAIIDSNKKIKAAHEIVSEAEENILDDFSTVLVSNSI